MKKKIGVYVCHCGGNISDYVDIEKVKEAVKDEADVFLLKNTMFACSDSSQKEMESDIKSNELDAIVVASCSPKLHVPTFRGVANRAGLNQYNYVQVNIREQGSWAHSDNPPGATEKAINLVKAGIARARASESLTPLKIPAINSVTVIGAGVGGMKSAIALSDMGSDVILIEKEKNVGGHISNYGKLFTTDQTGKELIEELDREIKSRANIKVFTDAELIEKNGSVGSFDIKVKVADETINLRTGSFVVNTGFDNYTPSEAEYGYGIFENVITLPAFKLLVDSQNSDKLVYNGKKIKNIAYIYCVGSRQEDGGANTYCSRYCCTSVIHTAILAKKKFANITNLHYHRGIRTYGKQELLYEESCKNGDIYLQFELKDKPEIKKSGKDTIITVKDLLTSGKTIEAKVDLIVLVTSMVARKNDNLNNLLKLPLSRDGFYNEIHMKLRPVETVIEGILIAGTSQYPKNIIETINSSMAASSKANAMLNKGEMTLEPTLAMVNPAACVWCDNCTNICQFDAILKEEYEGKMVAKVNISNCKGCGMCTPVCPTDAIDLAGFTNAQIEGMIDALAES
jgi:heterodisulfide reductase subunit A